MLHGESPLAQTSSDETQGAPRIALARRLHRQLYSRKRGRYGKSRQGQPYAIGIDQPCVSKLFEYMVSSYTRKA